MYYHGWSNFQLSVVNNPGFFFPLLYPMVAQKTYATLSNNQMQN